MTQPRLFPQFMCRVMVKSWKIHVLPWLFLVKFSTFGMKGRMNFDVENGKAWLLHDFYCPWIMHDFSMTWIVHEKCMTFYPKGRKSRHWLSYENQHLFMWKSHHFYGFSFFLSIDNSPLLTLLVYNGNKIPSWEFIYASFSFVIKDIHPSENSITYI